MSGDQGSLVWVSPVASLLGVFLGSWLTRVVSADERRQAEQQKLFTEVEEALTEVNLLLSDINPAAFEARRLTGEDVHRFRELGRDMRRLLIRVRIRHPLEVVKDQAETLESEVITILHNLNHMLYFREVGNASASQEQFRSATNVHRRAAARAHVMLAQARVPAEGRSYRRLPAHPYDRVR